MKADGLQSSVFRLPSSVRPERAQRVAGSRQRAQRVEGSPARPERAQRVDGATVGVPCDGAPDALAPSRAGIAARHARAGVVFSRLVVLLAVLAAPARAAVEPDGPTTRGEIAFPAEATSTGVPAAAVPPAVVAVGPEALSGEVLPGGAIPLTTVLTAPTLGEMGAVLVQSPPPAGPTIEYYALDALGSIRVVFDAAGQVLARADYEPFGAHTPSTTGPLPRERFTGQERDSEIGLDYFGARFYHASHGRFLAVDPLYVGAMGDPQRWNRYAYALNSPLVYTDPDGRTSCTTTSHVGGFNVACSGGGNEYHGGGGPSVNTPSPGQGPLLGVHGDADYEALNFGAFGYRVEPTPCGWLTPCPQQGIFVATTVEVDNGDGTTTTKELFPLVDKDNPDLGFFPSPVGAVSVAGGLIGRVLARVFGGSASRAAAAAAARYPRQLEQASRMTPPQLQRSVMSFTETITKHQRYLTNPQSHVPNWNQLTPQHQQSLIYHWNNDIARAQAYRDIAEGVLRGILK
jgi:RHS repeat-associated protein